MKDFRNNIQKAFYREYDRLRIVENVLFRVTKYVDGFNRTQFVQPKQVTVEVVEQIHTSGRKKTLQKITERMYRPMLKEEVIKVVQTCDICQKLKKEH